MNAPAFFDDYIAREEMIKELKEELKAAIDSFAQSNNLTTKGIIKGVKEYQQYLKNEAEFRVTDADADVIFDQLAGSASNE